MKAWATPTKKISKPKAEIDAWDGDWHSFDVTMNGDDVNIRLDGESLLEASPASVSLDDEASPKRGRIGLQFREGEVTFRNIRPPGAPDHVPSEGAVAVLWLPEHAPTNTGSYPMLP